MEDIKEIKEIMKWKTITPRRIEKLLEHHKIIFGSEMGNWYKTCKCPDALRTMLGDIKLYIMKNE